MTNSDSINYTFIIPHKNIPSLLCRCLDSIPNRNDIQIIVVDDNSDPNIVDFSDFPGLNKKNTEVYFTKEGKGAGFARNFAIEKAKGKWIIFADADDFFNECLDRLMDYHVDSKADIIFFQSNSVDNETLSVIQSRGNQYNKWLIESHKRGIVLNEIRYRIHPPWSKFYSHQLILNNSISFDEVIASNDVMFSLKCGFFASKIEIDLNYLYCSTIRIGSLEYSSNFEKSKMRSDIALKHYIFLRDNNLASYRMNVFLYPLALTKYKNSKWFKIAIIPLFNNVEIKHIIYDFLIIIKDKFKHYLGSAE